MLLIRNLIMLAMVLLLAGCFRQADDEFETISSQPDTQPAQIATNIPTQPIILNPNETTDNTGQPVITSTAADSATIQPLGAASVTPTIIIIQPVTSATPITTTRQPSVTPPSAPTLLPTATPPQIITPEPGNPAQLVIPSVTPGGSATPVSVPGLPPTPTDLANVPTGECEYTIAAGDNLFRIAVNNGVSLSDLLLANDLTENSIIQPGQILQIPGCLAVDGETIAPVATTAGGVTTGVATATALPPGVTLHTVSSGETLGAIARRYGVSIQALVDANDLANPDSLSIGQQLVIPSQP